jgi:putative colanic acid biosynthesis acetyltransferase WcaF
MRPEDPHEFRKIRAKPALPRMLLAKRLLWSIVQATVYRHSFHRANGWRAWLLRAFGARVGAACTIRRTSRVYYPWNLSTGDLACLGDDSTVYNLGHIHIGYRALISQEAYLCAGTHDYRTPEMPLVNGPITIEDDAWVCARAFIGPGVTVGRGAIVGAGAVAMRDVPEWTIVGGNPAQFIKHRPRFDATMPATVHNERSQ